jgi:hypothetical protein
MDIFWLAWYLPDKIPSHHIQLNPLELNTRIPRDKYPVQRNLPRNIRRKNHQQHTMHPENTGFVHANLGSNSLVHTAVEIHSLPDNRMLCKISIGLLSVLLP